MVQYVIIDLSFVSYPKLNIMKYIKFLIAGCLLLSASGFAQNVKVAASANLQSIIKVLGQDFKQKTGITIETIVSSSGNLTTQMKNGAPYAVFLSTAMSFSAVLLKKAISASKPAVY